MKEMPQVTGTGSDPVEVVAASALADAALDRKEADASAKSTNDRSLGKVERKGVLATLRARLDAQQV